MCLYLNLSHSVQPMLLEQIMKMSALLWVTYTLKIEFENLTVKTIELGQLENLLKCTFDIYAGQIYCTIY